MLSTNKKQSETLIPKQTQHKLLEKNVYFTIKNI